MPRFEQFSFQPFPFNYSFLPLNRQLHTRSDKGYGSLSVWFVDSAVRWRRNDAVGLRNSCLRTVVRSLVFVVLRFCNSQSCVSRSLPARWIAASAVAGLAAPQAAFASFRKSARCLSSQALLRSALCCSRAEASGASICEPPQGGASARTAEAGI